MLLTFLSGQEPLQESGKIGEGAPLLSLVYLAQISASIHQVLRLHSKWTADQARAHQLLCTFLHELGHHHDRMTTKYKQSADRGEKYAESYARRYTELIWDRYFETIGVCL